MMQKCLSFLSFLVVAGGLPRLAEACSVCFSAKEGQIMAYWLTAVVLTVLPFLMIGGFLLYLRKHRP